MRTERKGGDSKTGKRKGEKVTGHGAEREEWIKSNRGPDRAQWRMEKKQKHAPGKTEGLKNRDQELDSETQRKTKKPTKQNQ